MHWYKDCPYKEEEEDVTLFASGVQDQYLPTFMSETFNSAILDSGCSRTVCGKIWYDQYSNSLSKEQADMVEEMQSFSKFKFGCGQAFESIKRVKLPAKIGMRNVKIETDIVEAEIPMLLSKNSMKKADAKLDFVNDTVDMFGENLN